MLVQSKVVVCEQSCDFVPHQRDHGSNLLRLSLLFKSCGLWTLSCDFVLHNYETLKCLSSLPILMQESLWQRSGREYIISLSSILPLGEPVWPSGKALGW